MVQYLTFLPDSPLYPWEEPGSKASMTKYLTLSPASPLCPWEEPGNKAT